MSTVVLAFLFVFALLLLAVGFAIGVLWSRGRHGTELAEARALLAVEGEKQQQVQETLRAQISDIARQTVQASESTIAQIAASQIKESAARAEGELAKRVEAVDAIAKPIQKSLADLHKVTGELEGKRAESYKALNAQVEVLRTQTHGLQQALSNASQARGTWGEVTLMRILELAGVARYAVVTEQAQLESGLRPDVLVRLPGGRTLPIDAKAPAKTYLDALAAEPGPERDALFKKHANNLYGHVKTLGRKDYQSQVDGDFDQVLLFVPSEAIAAAAFATDPELFERALKANVLVVTPVSLLATLRAIALYWQNAEMEENVRAIGAQATELYDRVTVFAGHVSELGKDLNKVNKKYDAALGSFQRRVRPSGEKLKALGLPTKSDALPEPPALSDAIDAPDEGPS